MEQAKEGSATDSSSEAISSQSHSTHLLSKLPTREGWTQPLVLYKNFWIRPPMAINIMHLQNSFKARQDDIIIASNPKCGTTWLKALAFTITNRSRYEFGNHPLLFRHPQEVIPFIEIPLGVELTYVDTLSSPRVLATHMPFSLLPNSITTCGCRIVYICRGPTDAFVSRWHFENKISREYSINVEDALDMFCEGFSPYGPFWEHCLEYWRESIASPDKVLFLKYEDMTSEPVKYVKRIASFLGVPFSIKEQEDGVPEEVVRLCSFEKLSGLHANQAAGDIARHGNMVIDKSVFFRKGIVGDWVNHISEEMGRKIDCVIEEKLKGSGLVF